ncbi:lipoyl synthase [Acidaminobacter hydrogenoformans]|uniref:Lipoyl synthase n=1 Tax=Acidaminobacter hydrogenoformans DSM 2784 TaxID=1120920 RepID=A0A1G5S165_9FIRM|nr:lipoyl synthase [Acidaminobacter hydrogenoformans]SCZ79481.1 lipoic acid synthetase [Acidaminobacter hydrogenoformans DSM 2784]
MIPRPEWLKQKAPNQEVFEEMGRMLELLSLHTVCESANCPNIGKCFENKTATFMIMGDICTRNCRFCAVPKGIAGPLDFQEPLNVAKACRQLELKHAVITSVTRDDLEDGGAGCFARTVEAIRLLNADSTIELLIPDLCGNWSALAEIVIAKPDIINHNVETVPELYEKVRPQADYGRSVELLRRVKEMDGQIYTKSGLMLGLGETDEQIIQVMRDLLLAGCDILTLGQYLRPSEEHIPIFEYVTPNKFDELRDIAIDLGFKYVASGPFVRSSYKAFVAMEELRKG